MGERPAIVTALGASIAVVLLAGVAAWVTHDPGTQLPHPDRWDERVLPLVDFVEDTRGLTFRHPVFIDFLTPAEYTAATTTDESDLGDDSRQRFDRRAGELRALGVASGPVDLLSAYNAVSDGGTLAYYDPRERRIRVRGTELTVGLRVTLVHELVHALQDQHFDLSRIYDDDLDDGESTALRGLIEGDAQRIEFTYTEKLVDEERADYVDEYAALVERSSVSTTEVPPFLVAYFSMPYVLGHPFAVMLELSGGNGAVDDAFRDPPSTEEHLFDPASFLNDEGAEAAELELDGVEPLDEGTFGPTSWFLMLAERIEPKVAFYAALGWAGDQYASYESDGRSCVRAAFIGDSRKDEQQMADAIEQWADALPGGLAEVLELDGHPAFEACDPGPDVDMQLTNRVADALRAPVLWAFLVARVGWDLDGDGSRCFAHEVMAEMSYAEMIDPDDAAFASEAFERRIAEARAACA